MRVAGESQGYPHSIHTFSPKFSNPVHRLIHHFSPRYPHSMKFTCNKAELDKQLQHVSRIVMVRQTAPVLSNVLLETDNEVMRISGTDLDLTISTHLPAKIEQEGTFTVPAKIFQEFVHQNPDESIEMKLEGFEMVCTSANVTARISGMDADEFPSLPKVEKGSVFILSLPELVEALKKVVIAAANDPSRPILTGVYFQFGDALLTLATTDSFRLVEKKIKITPTKESFTLLVPARAIQELIRISTSAPEIKEVEVEVSEQQVIFRLGAIELFSRLLVGAFPKYTAIIPQKFVAMANVTTSELVQALRLSAIFSQAGVANVMLEIDAEGNFSLASYGSQRGTTKHTIHALLEEGFTPIRAAFNARFLLDACSATDASHVQLHFSGTTSALMITTDELDYLQLVMPIRLES